jgi:hypothetical protein
MGMNDFLTKRAEQAASKVEDAKRDLDKRLENMEDMQNDIVQGMISIYEAQEAIAAHLKVKLPEPKIKMEIEDD